MKKFAKLFACALVFALIASLFMLNTSAAAVTDPNELKPTSDSVVFIMDEPEGGTLPGDGTGKDANNPYQPIDHEGYNPNAEPGQLKQHLQTAFYQASELLEKTGGTIVVCGPVHLGPDDTWGTVSGTTRDVYLAKNGTNTIKITSKYDGVDNRETNGAKITLEAPAEIGTFGQTNWEYIDIETIGSDRVISFNDFATLVGEGVNCYPKEELYAAVPSMYISLSSGHRYNGGVDKTPNLVVKSGTYNIISASIWGVNNNRSFKDDGSIRTTSNHDGATNAKLVLEGTTKVLGQVIGTTRFRAEFSGATEIIINGGTYPCDIVCSGITGFSNREGIATLRINGGDFKDAWVISPVTEGNMGNAPAASLLDLSGFKGDNAQLAKVYSLAANAGFTSIKLPDGVNADQLAQITPPVSATTPSGNGGTTITPEGDNNGQGGIIIGGDDAESTYDKQNGGKVDIDGESGNNMMLIVVIIAAVVIVALVVVIIVILSKNKKTSKEEK